MNTALMNQYKYLAKQGDGALAFNGSVPCYLPNKSNGCYESENGSLMFYGKCVQNGTPSPSSPVAVEYVDGDGRIGVQQLVQNGNFVDTSRWWFGDGNNAGELSVSNNIGTVRFTNKHGENVYFKSNRYSMADGDKYFSTITAKTTASNIRAFRKNIGYWNAVPNDGIWHTFEWIDNRDTNANRGVGVYYATTETSFDVTVYVKNAMCINLTAMYGAGNEPSTVEQFKQMYPDDYYAYMYGTTLTMPDLYGIGDIRDTYEPCVWVNGALRSRLTRRIGKIDSYNGESVGSVYMSSTGELSTGATVYYPLATPVITLGDPQPVQSYGGATNIFHTSVVQPKIAATVVQHS